tara:strand:+ start:2104 stop:2277 length:174 start_codon:yes stop_codon:yes gene_type:complete
MFYRYEEEIKNWNSGKRVLFPDGTIISKDNKIEHEGWFWSDEPPTEYTEWLNEQENF